MNWYEDSARKRFNITNSTQYQWLIIPLNDDATLNGAPEVRMAKGDTQAEAIEYYERSRSGRQLAQFYIVTPIDAAREYEQQEVYTTPTREWVQR